LTASPRFGSPFRECRNNPPGLYPDVERGWFGHVCHAIRIWAFLNFFRSVSRGCSFDATWRYYRCGGAGSVATGTTPFASPTLQQESMRWSDAAVMDDGRCLRIYDTSGKRESTLLNRDWVLPPRGRYDQMRVRSRYDCRLCLDHPAGRQV